jgi:hypothetical protein
MDRWSVPPTRFQRWIARHRASLLTVLVALLLADLVLAYLDLTTSSGRTTVGAIGGAAGIIGALVSFRDVAKFVDTWDAKHGKAET